MVETPWGDSGALRERMLPPGPANAAEEVEGNQRQRLFGAMVASVAERGYWNTRVSDLVEISGVSLRSFYELFPDKRACFIAAVDSLMQTAIEPVLRSPVGTDWVADSRQQIHTVAALVAAQPAASKMCLVESYVAGPEAVNLIEASAAGAEKLLRQRLAASPRWAGMSADIATIAMSAILETLRGSLIKEQTRRLPELADELAVLLLAYEPPAQPLRSAARTPEVRPEELEASDHAERALRAFEALLVEQPFAETTMEQVAKRAKMSVRTLYANFPGREELMLAAVDSAAALAIASALPAFRRATSPPEGIRAALGAFLGLLATRPKLANLLLRSVYEGGAPALERRAEALWPLRSLLVRTAPTELAAGRNVVSEAILGGLLGLARRRLIEDGPGALPGLTPICTYVALAPMLGVEQATAAAEGKSYERPRPDVAEAIRRAADGPGTERVWLALGDGPLSVAQLAAKTALAPAEVEAVVAHLEEEPLASLHVTEGESGERLYESHWPLINTTDWGDLNQPEREQISAEVLRLMESETRAALAAGTFDSRLERFLVRLPMWLDERGWQELCDALEGSLEISREIQERATRRLREGGQGSEGSPARVFLVSFEPPPNVGPSAQIDRSQP